MHKYITAMLFLFTAAIPSNADFIWGTTGHPHVQEGYRDIPVKVQLDLIKRSGLTWYRSDWPELIMQQNIEGFDFLVDEADRRGIHLLPILFPINGSRSDESLEEIKKSSKEFAKRVVSRYKGKITHWELSNELDIYAMILKGEKDRNGKVWEFGDANMDKPEHFNEERYAKVRAELSGLAEGVKEADPNAKTVINSSGWLHYAFFERLIIEDKIEFDIIGWHWYSEMGDITNADGTTNVLEILKRYGKPIWITEINNRGGSINSEQEQNNYIIKTAKQIKNYPGVDAYFVYELLDEPYFGPDNPESHFGIVKIKKNKDGKWIVGRRKIAYESIRQLTRLP
jgi:hypothetical protein